MHTEKFHTDLNQLSETTLTLYLIVTAEQETCILGNFESEQAETASWIAAHVSKHSELLCLAIS